MGNREYFELLPCNCGPLEYVYSTSSVFRAAATMYGTVNVALAGGYTVTWISERFMPSQINTKSCPKRISFAPLRHGRYFNRDTFVYRAACGKTGFQSVKKVQAVYFPRPQKFAPRFSQRVSKMFSTLTSSVSTIYYRAVIALFVCKRRTRSIIFLQ